MIAGGLSAVDVAIERLREVTSQLAVDLFALDGHQGRALLDPPDRCTGMTAARAVVALDRLAWLFERYLELSDLIATVDALPGGRSARRRERATILLRAAATAARPRPPHPETGDPSATDPGPAPTAAPSAAAGPSAGPAPSAGAAPSAGGGWAPGAAQVAVPERLLADISKTVGRVRADFDAVQAAQDGLLSDLTGVHQEVARVSAEAARIGATALAELGAAEAALAAVMEAAARDPLGAPPGQATRAGEAVAHAAAAVDALALAYDALDTGLRDAGMLLEEIVDTATAGEWSAQEATGRIRLADGDLLGLPDGWLDDPGRGLRPWLDRLRGLAAGPPERRLAAARGLAAWTAVAERTRAHARQVADANALPLRRRGELRGLLGALRQKAVASGLAEDPALEIMYASAHDLLYTAPTDLAAASAQVTVYAAALDRDRKASPPAAGRTWGHRMDEGRGGAPCQ
ncbi:conserved hypothetical protein [Frankia canadensis]|uniref:Uncharacterized protein n=1 Tax=Frankia canadensis TaxID=1836972 RepID=A0A2I2L0R9_9ACTN|nr:hypothetical protein [Frankia canadensis]SNQ51499.1 conserved hypothetical protein [Frankia canadensis]SOU58789.1 conserved hypothetical protein [Frankia canadensis]